MDDLYFKVSDFINILNLYNDSEAGLHKLQHERESSPIYGNIFQYENNIHQLGENVCLQVIND